ncbi:MAG: hypothetical protein AAFZ17_20635, partial [Cyanobacteria bacterium J06650_10]
MLDSVKSNFSVDFRSNKLADTRPIQADTTSLDAIGQIGRNFDQNLPISRIDSQFELPTLDLRNSAAPLKSTAAPTITADIKRSLSKESSSWQGGLLGNEASPIKAVSTSENLVSSRRASAKARPGSLSQSQLNNATGTFVVGKSGKVKVDYLFDGSTKEGELAIFSLDGMGGLNKSAFIK